MTEAQFQQYLDDLVNNLASKVSGWLVAQFSLGGWWATVVTAVIGWIFENCLNPRKRGDEFKRLLADQAGQYRAQVDPPRQVSLPKGREPIPAQVRIEASPGEVTIGYQMLVIPFSQDVRIRWDIWAHASLCMEQVCVVDIVSGAGTPFQREVWGNNGDGGERVLRLDAGVYLVRIAGSNEYCGGAVTINYQTVPEAKQFGTVDWGKVGVYAAIGVGIGGLLYGAAGLLRGR